MLRKLKSIFSTRILCEMVGVSTSSTSNYLQKKTVILLFWSHFTHSLLDNHITRIKSNHQFLWCTNFQEERVWLQKSAPTCHQLMEEKRNQGGFFHNWSMQKYSFLQQDVNPGPIPWMILPCPIPPGQGKLCLWKVN